MINVRNFIRATLRAPLNTTSNVLQLTAGQGSRFAIPTGDYMYLTISDPSGEEVVRYTSTGTVAGDNIVVDRAQDGTTARPFPAGSCVVAGLNSQQLKDLIAACFALLAPTLIPVTPSNTVVVTGAPVAPPTSAAVLYAINTATSPASVYFWNTSTPTAAWILTGDGVGPPLAAPTVVAAGQGVSVAAAGSTYTVAARLSATNNLNFAPNGDLRVYQCYLDSPSVPSGGSTNFTVSGPPGALAYSSGFRQNTAGLTIDTVETLEFTIPVSGVLVFPVTALPAFAGTYARTYTFRDATTGAWLGNTPPAFVRLL